MTASAPANLPAERKPQVHAGGAVAALVPQTLDEAFRVATAIASSGLAPQGIQRADQIMVAIMAGAELGLAPFQALQSFAVINGRPTLYGDGLIAVARAQGVQVKEWMEGEGEGTVAWCEVTRPDSDEQIKRSFSTADAKKAGLWGKSGPWTQYPKRMLGMRARAWALRDGCADMLRGFHVREEVEDYEVREAASQRATGMRARLEAREASTRDQQGFDADHVSTMTAPVAEAEFTEHPAAEPEAETPSNLAAKSYVPSEDDSFPGDKPSPTAAAGSAEQAPADAGLPEGMKRGSDLLKEKEAAAPDLNRPADPLEWKAEAERYVEMADKPETLEALNTQWDVEGRWDRLKAASRADWQDLVDKMRARLRELEREAH